MPMDLDLDRRLRIAAFAHVARLSAASGGRLTSAQLNGGFTFEGTRVPIWNQQRGIYKPGILGRDGAALSFQTSFDDPYEDVIDRADDRFVYRYQGRDPEHSDNRAMRRAFENRLPLLYLVGVEPGVYEPIIPCYIVGDDPARLSFYVLADVGEAIKVGTLETGDSWPLKAYVTRAVKQRLHQDRFRYLVLRAYRKQCAMCRLRHDPLLEAAHILPDRDPRGNPEVPNGLSLCRIHHGAYDANILGIDADYLIHVRRDILDEIDGPMLVHGIQELQHASLQLPRRPQDKPNREYLAERYRLFQAA